MTELEKKIFNIIKIPHLTSLATVDENGLPWVRYVMAIGDENLSLRFSTFTGSKKVAHIKNNPHVHLTCGVSDIANPQPYLQILGKAFAARSQEEKNNFWNKELEKVFSGPDDPNYMVLTVKPEKIEYTLPHSPAPPQIWTDK